MTQTLVQTVDLGQEVDYQVVTVGGMPIVSSTPVALGPQGPPGPKGDTGDTGPQGPAGDGGSAVFQTPTQPTPMGVSDIWCDTSGAF